MDRLVCPLAPADPLDLLLLPDRGLGYGRRIWHGRCLSLLGDRVAQVEHRILRPGRTHDARSNVNVPGGASGELQS